MKWDIILDLAIMPSDLKSVCPLMRVLFKVENLRAIIMYRKSMKKVLKLDLLLIFVFIHYHSVQLNITLFLLFIFTIPMNPPGLPPASLSLTDSYL